MLASSVSVSVPVENGPVKLRPPRELPPAVNFSTTFAALGSGHSAYGVGLALPHARLAIDPPATFEPAAVATALASVRCVEFGMSLISTLLVVVEPLAAVTCT